MIPRVKQYDSVISQLHYKETVKYDAFKIFVQMFAAIAGGSIWLRLEMTQAPPRSYAHLTDALVFLLMVVCVASVVDSFRSWWDYREKLSRLDKTVPRPRFPAGLMECIMSGAMLLATWAFVELNPFRL